MQNPFTIDRSVDPSDRAMAVRMAVMSYMLKGGAIAGVVVGAVVVFIYVLKFVATFLPEDPYAAAPIEVPVQVASAPVACFSGCPGPMIPAHVKAVAAGSCGGCHATEIAAIESI